MRIGFIWQGYTERKHHWNDGLRAAMRILETQHQVTYLEPWDDLDGYDVLLYWEAPCTTLGPNAHHYNRIMHHGGRKVLLFAGGPIKKEWVRGFDLLAVESAINEDECRGLGIPYARAFGVNTDVFRPLRSPTDYVTVTHGTCASWKRQQLVCQAMGREALVFGAYQETDPAPFQDCESCHSKVIREVPYEEVNRLINLAEISVNCADFWGGGQRATLEAMACNLPVVVMADSPKNREFIEESGIGLIAAPEVDAIRNAVAQARQLPIALRQKARDYVLSKWTPQHYADSINAIIRSL